MKSSSSTPKQFRITMRRSASSRATLARTTDEPTPRNAQAMGAERKPTGAWRGNSRNSSRSVVRPLKQIFQSELDQARVRAGGADDSETGRTGVLRRPGVAELRVIEDVEELRAKLQGLALRDLGGLNRG